MFKTLSILFFVVLPFSLWAQVLPKEGSSLHYRLIGFSFPSSSQVSSYRIEIADGYYNNTDSFGKKIINTVEGNSNKIVAEVPAFGASYTWRVVYKGKKKNEGTFYHFSTRMNQRVDTSKLRMRVMQPAAREYKDNYIVVDGGGVLYDMNGRPVWYIPDTNGYGGNVADIKFTPEGTITFNYRKLFEINYNGDVLWHSSNKGIMSGDTAHGELYHHEFKKLSNGHYMALAMELLSCKIVKGKDSSYIVVSNENARIERPGYRQGKFGCLLEYDEKGDVVWSWKSSKYLLAADLAYFSPVDSNQLLDAHDNSFFFDEKNSCIYVGFKNINRIIKIEYPSGKVSSVYGSSLKPGENGVGEGLFCNQHSIGRTMDGYLYYFNNNSCVPDLPPSVVMLQEPTSEHGIFKKIWEYDCIADGKFKSYFSNGGNAVELLDRSLFINMGSKYSKLQIVGRDKKTYWSALPEKYMETEDRWIPVYEYRANIISREGLEKLIWAAEIPISSK